MIAVHVFWFVILFGVVQSRSLEDYKELGESNPRASQSIGRTRFRIPQVEKAGYTASTQKAVAFAEPGADKSEFNLYAIQRYEMRRIYVPTVSSCYT
jgi:hypothetical protein